MFVDGALFISNNIGYHFYHLQLDDVAIAYCGIVLLMFVTSIGTTREFSIALSTLLGISLLVYIMSTIRGSTYRRLRGNDIGKRNKTRYSIVFFDYLVVFLNLGLQTLDVARREDVTLSPTRLSLIATTYMFALTGLRRRCMILIWLLSVVFRMTIVNGATPALQSYSSKWSDGDPAGLSVFLHFVQSLHHLCLGLLLYKLIYFVGTDIIRTRLRPRIILNDIPHIARLEQAVYANFYHRYNLLPPISLSTYDHLLLLLHMNKHQLLSRLHMRQKKLFSRFQADFIRRAVLTRQNDEQPAGQEAEPAPDIEDIRAKLREIRMRERISSLNMRLTPAQVMFSTRRADTLPEKEDKPHSCQSAPSLDADNFGSEPEKSEAGALQWQSEECIICEASVHVQYSQFRQTIFGSYTDHKLERWFLAWSLVSNTRLLVAARKVLLSYLILGVFASIGSFNGVLHSICANGFRSNLAVALYVLRIVTYTVGSSVFLASTAYSKQLRLLEWVNLAERQTLKYRAFGFFTLLTSVLDWILTAEQLGVTKTESHFLHRTSQFIQPLVYIPFLVSLPPHILTLVYALFIIVLIFLCAIWPVEVWTICYDVVVTCGGAATSILFVCVPYYRVLRCLFSTYAAPYLLYIEALRPRDPATDEEFTMNNETENKHLLRKQRANTIMLNRAVDDPSTSWKVATPEGVPQT